MKPKHFYTYKDKRYSVRALSKLSGICVNTIRSRLNNGWSMVEAVEKPNSRPITTYEYHGENYTVSQLARKFDISRDIIRNRLKKGWSIEQISTSPKTKRRICNWTNKGRTLQTFATCTYRCNAK